MDMSPLRRRLTAGCAGTKATLNNSMLCLTGPELTADEWAVRFVTEH